MTSSTERVRTEDLEGDDLLAKLKKVIHEGNVRRIIVKAEDGHVIAEFPVTVGVVGALVAPAVAAIGAIVALAKDCTITVERREEPA